MPKHPFVLVAAAACIAGLASCDPPLPPPPLPPTRPMPPYSADLPPPGTPGYDVSPPPPPGTTPDSPPAVMPPGTYPVAQRTENPDQVISPYEPYNVIDIAGPPRMQSGQLARDPSNRKIFRVP